MRLVLLMVGLFVLALGGQIFLLLAGKLRGHAICRRFFYVPARKSSTNALQLGGLPVALTVMIAMFFFLNQSFIDFVADEGAILVYGLLSSGLVVIYGYLDDKYELRPIVKLIAQVLAVFIFALMSSQILMPEHSVIAFIVVGLWGLGVINGSNLLDGLDTLALKLNMISYSLYLAMGIFFGNSAVVFVAAACAISLLSFYFVNRFPAKIHLGEIGGSYLGLTNIILAALLFRSANVAFDKLYAVGAALIPLCLPMVEVGVSFMRRLYNNKTPFKGDRLHVHYLLRNYYRFSVVKTSNIMTISYAISAIISLVLALALHPLVGACGLTTMLVTLSMMVGRRYWVGENHIRFTSQHLLQYLSKKKIMVIETAMIDDFQITLVRNPVTPPEPRQPDIAA